MMMMMMRERERQRERDREREREEICCLHLVITQRVYFFKIVQYHSIRLVLFSWLPADSSRWVQCFHISCYQILKITDELIWTVNFTDMDRYSVCTKFDLVVFLIGQSTEKRFLRLFRNRFVIYMTVNLETKFLFGFMHDR